jgi:hypothetical protein
MSPELNPDELLNQDVKAKTMRKNRARYQNELFNNVRSYLRSANGNRTSLRDIS